MARECAICGQQFHPKPTGRKAVVCGATCRSEYGRRAMREKYRAKVGAGEIGPNKECRGCGTRFPCNSLRQHYCSAACQKHSASASDSQRKRSGPPVGGTIECSDCGSAAVRLGPRTTRCVTCQQRWDAKKSDRLRRREPDRQRALETAAAAKRRGTEEGSAAYRLQCKNWRSVPKNRLRGRMSAMMNRALSQGKQGHSWTDLVPYTLDELRAHLERQFCRGMSWQNMGRWHIDHIVPVSSFEFSSPEDDDFKACWALTNLRPLWAEENQRKSAKRTFLI